MSVKHQKKVCLVVLDGWGIGKKDKSNAVYMSETPFVDSLYKDWANAQLRTDGENVGLPDGQMGNSEVGHMNIGAGRVVYQDLVRINREIKNGDFAKNPVLERAFDHASRTGVNVHFMGLVSDGGVHSHLSHLRALCEAAVKKSLRKVFIHVFTDGRDTDPHGAKEYITEVESFIKGTAVKIASVSGRYYSMDRDKRWERVKKAYDTLVNGVGRKFNSALEAVNTCYKEGITDEFIVPSNIVDEKNNPVAIIGEGDVVICFNFRTDRCREITQVLTQSANHEYNLHPLNLHYVTMTNYDDTYRNVQVMYDKDNLVNTLGEIVSHSGCTQLRIAETEKYPHVTFFFSGGREGEFKGERRIMVSSPKVATYDLQPEMSAFEVAEKVSTEMKSNAPDFICLNFANPDMVGHTGVFSAIVKGVETTDKCLEQVVKAGLYAGYSFVILADHGNADCAVNDDGSPNTAHTTNPVPVFVIDPGVSEIQNGILADVAPTVLALMNLTQPKEMSGKSLIR